MGRKYKHISRQEFDVTHQLKESGVKVSKIAKLLERSRATVDRVLEAKDFKDYVERVLPEYKAKRYAQGRPTENTTELFVSEPVHENNQFDFKLLNDNLVNLASKLEGFTEAVHKAEISNYALRKTLIGQEHDSKKYKLWG